MSVELLLQLGAPPLFGARGSLAEVDQQGVTQHLLPTQHEQSDAVPLLRCSPDVEAASGHSLQPVLRQPQSKARGAHQVMVAGSGVLAAVGAGRRLLLRAGVCAALQR